jgi:hypothetical protein
LTDEDGTVLKAYRELELEGDLAPNQLSGEWLLGAGISSAEGARLRGGVSATSPTTVSRCLVEFGRVS